MIYPPIELKWAALVVGLVWTVAHLAGLVAGEKAWPWIRAFPRSVAAGRVLLVVATVWFLVMVKGMDLGEFSPLRNGILVVGTAGAVLSWVFLSEFLAARASGMVALLAAEPVLEACFLRPELGRYPLVLLAYAWIVAGLFWVGMPYVLRDQIAWVTGGVKRWRAACAAGTVFGLIVIAGGLIGK